MVVLKFGGKSLENLDKVNKICEYIKMRSQSEKIIVVVSAFGSTTDNLLELAYQYGGKENPNNREVDALLATGEMQASALVCLHLTKIGVCAVSLNGFQANIHTMGEHTSSVITGINKSKIIDLFKTYDVIVVAGFQGVNSVGEITTLGRGGSDTSAVALGAVLSCEVEIYSNYPGVYAGDPKNQDYIKLDSINYTNMQKLASMGAKVLSSQSVDIATQAKVPVVCKASTCPDQVGTFVNNVPVPITSIVVCDNLCQIKIVSSNPTNISKTLQYVLNNINYQKLDAEPCSISLIVDKCNSKIIESRLARLNGLLSS